jgi:endonuclease G
MGRLRSTPASRFVFIFSILVLGNSIPAWAKRGVDFQMALGNPTAATTDPSKTNNYLIARSQFTLSYNGIHHQPNWVSWSYSTGDSGSSGRTDAWSEETALPAGYYRVGIATFGSSFGESWDRGHMCPSADRTATVADNELTFRMSNMIPQAAQNNQGLWANFETYTRGLASDGDEILIICGPAQFTGNRIPNQMSVPGSVWKIIVEVPNASSTTPAYQRVTTNSRVIAILTPNTSSGLGTWESYITSVEEIEEITGFNFFSSVDPAVATYLKNVVDTGTGPNKPTVITSFSPASGAAGTTVTISGYNFGTTPTVQFNGATAVASVSGGTTITATVPAGAGTGPITVSGTGGTDTSASNFIVGSGTEPTLSLSTGSLTTPATIQGAAGASTNYSLSATNLTGSITISLSTNSFAISTNTNSASFTNSLTLSPTSGVIPATAIYVRTAASLSIGSVSGTISHSGGGVTNPPSIAVNGTVNSSNPTLSLSVTNLNGFSALQGSPSTSKSYAISGVNLTGPITVTPPSGYEISSNNIDFAGSVLLSPGGTTLAASTLYIRIAATAPVGTASGAVTHSGGGAPTQNLSLTGTVTAYTPGLASDVYWNFDTATPTSGVPAGVSVGAVLQRNNNGSTTMLTTTSGTTNLGLSGGNNWGAAARVGPIDLASSAYLEITITPNTNVTFALTGISFGSRSTGTGPKAYTLRSSADGYTSDVATNGLTSDSNWALKSNNNLTFSAQTATTFRLFGYAGTGSPGAGTANWRLDDLRLTVSAEVPAVTPVITSTNAVTATNYAGFSYQITASNSPVSYNASGLPNGLSINTSNGLISGTPAVTPGTYTVGLSAINSAGEGTQNLTLTLLKNAGAPTITSASNATAYLRSAFSFTATANPAATSFSFSGLPAGLTSSGAAISGTPTNAGTFNVGVTATNSLGSDAQNLTLTVLDPVISLSTNSVAGLSSTVGKEGSVQTYMISGSNLTSNITVTAPTHFRISADGADFTNNPITLTPTEGTLSGKMLFVSLATNAPVGARSGIVTHAGGGAVSQSLSVAGTVVQPQLSLSTNSLGGFSTRVGVVSAAQNYTVSGTELTGGLTVTAPAGFEISTDNISFTESLLLIPASGSLASQTIHVRISTGAGVGSLSGSITHEGGDVIPKSLSLSGTVVEPSITLSDSSLPAFTADWGSSSATQSYTVSGANLTGPVTVTPPSGFEISLDNSTFGNSRTLNPAGGSLAAVPVYVRLSSSAPLGVSSGSITHTGGEAADQNLAVTGTVNSANPTLSPSVTSLSGFTSTFGVPSASQAYTISGSGLTGTITVFAPSGFEVSLDNATFAASRTLSPVAGNLSGVTLYVRLSGTAPVGSPSGNVTHSGGSASTVTLGVTGTVADATPIFTLSTNSLSGFTSLFGDPGTPQSYTVSGSNLKGPITVTAPTGYEVSQDGITYAASQILTPTSGVLSGVLLQVRLSSTASVGAVSGNVNHTGGGINAQDLSVSGTVAGFTGPTITSTKSGSFYTNSAFSYQVTLATTNTNSTYSATGLPAGFSINPTNGLITGTNPATAATNQIVITVNGTQGISRATYRLRTMTAAEQSAISGTPSVVINKYQNATTDRVELLVTGDSFEGPPVDLRGMVIKDFSASMTGDQGGKYVFTQNPLWASVRAGTLIVLSAGNTLTQDFSATGTDYLLRVNLGNTDYFTEEAGGFNIGDTEMVMIKAANTGADGVAGGIHAASMGSAGTPYTTFTGRKLNGQALNGSRPYAYVVNGNSSLADFYSSSGIARISLLTFGSQNNADNGAFINSLRALDQTAPVVTLNGAADLTVAHGSGYTESGATATGATSATPTISGSVNPNAVGTYVLTYSASDAAGNVGRATRTVRVVDQTPPIITLNGPATVQIPYGTTYSDPGATATDAVDGDLSGYVQIMMPIQSASVGSYVKSYVVSDFSGNESEILVRTVEVVKATPAITGNPSASSITAGQSLASSNLSAGTASVPGGFAWTDASTVPSASGNYQVTFTPTDSTNYNTVTLSVPVTVNPALTPIESWGSEFGLSGSNAGANADPDGDGFSNAQEYAFGLNPTNAAGNPAVLSQGSSQVKLTFLQKETGGVTYAVKSASSLSGGFTNSVTPQEATDQTGVPTGYKRYEATLPTSTGRGFLKVEATLP